MDETNTGADAADAERPPVGDEAVDNADAEVIDEPVGAQSGSAESEPLAPAEDEGHGSVEGEPDPVVEDAASSGHASELALLVAELSGLRTHFETRVAEYETTVRELRETVETLQRQQSANAMKPMLQQFVDLYTELATAAQQASDGGAEQHAADLRFFAQSVENVLDHFDLVSVEAAVGERFDRRSQAAVLTRESSRAEQDQTVARVVRQGFRIAGEERVLIPARVVVWKYVPSAEAEDLGAAEAPGSGAPTREAHPFPASSQPAPEQPSTSSTSTHIDTKESA